MSVLACISYLIPSTYNEFKTIERIIKGNLTILENNIEQFFMTFG
jgi:hypothetical protein